MDGGGAARVAAWQGEVVLALAALILLAAASLARADSHDRWTGEWDTLWSGGGARVVFEQDGDRVTGTYPAVDGTIEGTADGRRLFGRWSHAGREGAFQFVISPDGRTFAGRFGTGGWWTGVRAAPDLDPALRVDRSSPAATLQSFLRLAGRAPGSFEWLGRAAALVVAEDGASGRSGLLDHVALLDRVLDRLTFRFADLPSGPADGGEATARLAQAGTGIGLDLAFRRVDGDWLIVAPPADELARLLDRLEAARPVAAAPPPSPRTAMKAFIRGMRAGDGEARAAALATLDAVDVPDIARTREVPLLAEFLFQVIDRVGFVYWQEIPDDPSDLAPYVHYRHPEGDVVIAPTEVDGDTVWRFTPDTLRTIRRVHAAVEDLPLPPELEGRVVADPYFRARAVVRDVAPALLAPLGRLERWQWLGILAFLAAGLVAGRFAAGLARRLAPHRVDGGRPEDRLVLVVLGAAITAVCVALSVLALVAALGLPPVEAGFADTVAGAVLILAAVPLLWEAVGTASRSWRRRRQVTAHQETFLAMVASLVRIALVAVAGLLLADVFDIPYQGVLAGLGIGGLAVALAVQPLLQNFIAGLVLYADHPLAVGDFCRFGDKLGTVEKVGLRSTRIRSLDRTVITVPNAEFANMQLENYSRRDRMWLRTILQLRYETTPDQLRFLMAGLRTMLEDHPAVLPEPLHVRLVGLGDYAIEVEVFAYVATREFDEFRAVREDVLLRVMDVVREAGCQIAFPSAVEYRADDTPPDPEARARAEAAVRRWREEGASVAGETASRPAGVDVAS